ncbi:MAG: rhodanese-like domain-containing protein [Acidimicrobiia bacterium]|nr:rhodanese-like domain-containing protein [Acidimicrobiia bacterium]
MSERTTIKRLLAVFVAFSLVALAGCGGDDAGDDTTTTTAAPATTTTTEATTTTTAPPATTTTTVMMIDEATVLAEYVVAENAEWGPVIGAEALFENLSDGDDSNDPFIVSVRAPDAYALGHIEGAINIPWKTIADPANLALLPTDQPIVVYCYTGHTGQVAATILNVLGYDVQNLKFGMMGWTADDEVLATGRYSAAPGYPTVTDAPLATETYELPAMATGETEASEIALASAQAMLADWGPVASAESLFENLSDGDDSNDPLVVSVRAPDAYALGHIEGAINIPWKVITDPANLASLPTDQPIVVYCYTGHTGQVAATALKMLGYDVTNMKFGMMGWTDDDAVLATGRYTAAPDYPTVTG